MKKLALIIAILLTVNTCSAKDSTKNEVANTATTSPKLVQSVEKNAVLNMKDCIELALQNSPKIKKARYNYGLSKGNLGIAKSGYFPTLGVGTGYNVSESRTNRNNTSSNIYSAEASIKQLIWNFGKTNANIKMYNFDRIAALYDFEDIVLDTIFTVKTNYYGVLAAKATVDVNRANVQINERNYQRTKAYFDEGIKSKIDLVNAEQDIEELLIARHKIGKNQTKDFEIRNSAEFQEKMKSTVKTFAILLASIASVSLLVGGIGIMNIMLVSVTERTKEIGIRMAIGAKPSDIRIQFLIESFLLSMIGGLIGVFLGILGAEIVQISGIMTVSISLFSILLSLGFSGAIGVLFGYYPAYKASLLNPIDALRYE